jgi:hypothetical protein
MIALPALNVGQLPKKRWIVAVLGQSVSKNALGLN